MAAAYAEANAAQPDPMRPPARSARRSPRYLLGVGRTGRRRVVKGEPRGRQTGGLSGARYRVQDEQQRTLGIR